MKARSVLFPVLLFGLWACGGSEPAQVTSEQLIGTEWQLADLGGGGVVADVQTTLFFPEEGRIGGGGGCNQYFGEYRLDAEGFHVQGVGATRMACPETVMDQEDRFLKALEGAERIELREGMLYIHAEGLEAPLRFEAVE
jgi:heat shock protein HslJ